MQLMNNGYFDFLSVVRVTHRATKPSKTVSKYLKMFVLEYLSFILPYEHEVYKNGGHLNVRRRVLPNERQGGQMPVWPA